MSTARARQTTKMRAAIRADISSQPTGYESRERCAEHLDSPNADEWLSTLKVIDLLLWCRKVGDRHALTMLEHALVGQDRPVGSLSPRERKRVCEALLIVRRRERLPEQMAAAS